MISITIFGIKISISAAFLGVLAFMLYIDRGGLMLPTAASVIAHEAGHIFALTLFGAPPDRVELRAAAVTLKGRFCLSPRQEIFMLMSGPAVGLLQFLIFGLLYLAFLRPLFINTAAVGLVLCLINLLPVWGLDGGSILICLLSPRLGRGWATRLVTLTSLAGIFGLLCLTAGSLLGSGPNLSAAFLILYLILGLLLLKKQNKYCIIRKNRVK